MAKINEIDYVKNIVLNNIIEPKELSGFFMNHPFSKENPARYMIDIGQILMLLPPPPCRLLDLGVGSGWTSEFFSKVGYEVVGLDICPDMIEMAKKRLNGNLLLEFYCCDYEEGMNFGIFDCAVIYDALHHAENEERVINNVFECLKSDGIFITVEPGKGHSTSQDSIQTMKKFGTTEKDMEFSHQAYLMKKVGFGYVEQIIRLSELNSMRVTHKEFAKQSWYNFCALAWGTANGHTSICRALKSDYVQQEFNFDHVIKLVPKIHAQVNEVYF